MQVYFIGSEDQRGTYFFYSQTHRSWVVADLSLGKAGLYYYMVTATVDAFSDANDVLEKEGLGQDGVKWLMPGEVFQNLERDFGPKEVRLLMQYLPDGRTRQES